MRAISHLDEEYHFAPLTVDVGLHVQYTVGEEQWSSGSSSSAIEGLHDESKLMTDRHRLCATTTMKLRAPFRPLFSSSSFLPFSYFDFVVVAAAVATIVGGFGLLLCCTVHVVSSLKRVQ